MESIDLRKTALLDWLGQQHQCSMTAITPLAGDASFRRYFRLTQSSGPSLIAMDAPPPREKVAPFIFISKALRAMDLQAPEILAANEGHGFLLLTDFGDATLLKTLTATNADTWYLSALTALCELQTCRYINGYTIPIFTRDFMWQEWAWHQEWFLEKYLGLPPLAGKLDSCMTAIIDSAATQPQVFMHRDYHSANLMCLPNNTVGILDFQDAFIGPITYDAVSLLRDCYIDWPAAHVNNWARHYFDMLCAKSALPAVDADTFIRWFDWMGVQRHLKALLTFARKQVRDQQSNYLVHIPRTMKYLLNVTQSYPELAQLHTYLSQDVATALHEENIVCAH